MGNSSGSASRDSQGGTLFPRISSLRQSSIEDPTCTHKGGFKDDRQELRRALFGNQEAREIFGHLQGVELEMALQTFTWEFAKQGQDVIRQGDLGNRMYIIAEGEVEVSVLRDGHCPLPSGKGRPAGVLGPHAMFGHFALTHQVPRLATITASSPNGVHFWSLDREGLEAILQKSVHELGEPYSGWLTEVHFLRSMNRYEISRLAANVTEAHYEPGEVIVRQGEIGLRFYILRAGSCVASVSQLLVEGEREVRRYTEFGEYFGEAALITGQRRSATVRASGTHGADVCYVSHEAFWHLLGPVVNQLTVDIDNYDERLELEDEPGLAAWLQCSMSSHEADVAGDSYNNTPNFVPSYSFLALKKSPSKSDFSEPPRQRSFIIGRLYARLSKRYSSSKGNRGSMPTLLTHNRSASGRVSGVVPLK